MNKQTTSNDFYNMTKEEKLKYRTQCAKNALKEYRYKQALEQEPNTVIATGDGAYYKIKALQEPYDFARWVASEIFDDMWEYNKYSFAEIACRKLAKLGIVRAKGDEWELIEPQENGVSE